MTTIDELTKAPLLTDDDLFVIWLSGSGRTRSISGKTLRDNLLENGFNPDAFVSGRIDDVADKLYMTNQYGLEVEIGTVISLLSNHNIEELKNIPPLEANKLFKVNSNGSGVEYYDLNTLRIEDLSNIPSIKALGYLRGSKDGSYAEWIASSGTKIGIQEKGVNKGNANTLNANKNLLISLNNDIATIDLDSQITADIAYNASDIKTANQEIEKNKDTISNIDKLANDNKNAIANIDHTKIYKDNTTLEIKSKGGVRLNEQDGTNKARLELASNQKDDQVSIESNSTKGSLLFSSVKALEWTASTVSVNLPILVQGKKVATDDIIANVSDDAVLKSQGNDVVKVSSDGITISGTGATNTVRMLNGMNANSDTFQIQQGDSAGNFQKDWIDFKKDEGINFYNNGLPTGSFGKYNFQGNSLDAFEVHDSNKKAGVMCLANQAICIFSMKMPFYGEDAYNQGFSIDLQTGGVGANIKVPLLNVDEKYNPIPGTGNSTVRINFGGINYIPLNHLMGTWQGKLISDLTLMKNVKPLDGLSFIDKLNPKTWDWKNPKNHLTETPIGYISDDVEKEFPDVVTINEDGIKQITVKLTDKSTEAVLIAAIKQLSKKNDALESRLSALEAANSVG